jgi:hypothetical protein
MRRIFCVAAVLLAAPAPSRSSIHVVRAGEDLQTALNAARAGDEIRLERGATFTGNFVLPVFDGDAPVMVRTDLSAAELLPPDQRVTPAAAASFARIVSPNGSAALQTAPAARHWRLAFLEFPATRNGSGDIIQIGDGSSAQSQLSQVPSDITLDHLYVHGDPQKGQKRGIALNGASVTIRDCHVSDIKAVGADAQAIAGWNGPGPYVIENNYLEAGGEVFLLGGADPGIRDLVPSDVTIRHNQFSRPLEWRGSRWQVKNILELKNARRVVVEANLLENNWQAAQPGYAVLFTPRNQDGACPWCVVESVNFTHNVVRNVAAGINLSGHDSPNQSRQTNGIRIEGNLFDGVTTKMGGNGWGMLIGDGPRDVTVAGNTWQFDGTTLVYAYGAPRIDGFRFVNNAAPHGQYGINGADASTGTLTFERFFNAPVVAGNWLSGGPGGRYPTGNRFDAPFDPANAKGAGVDVAAMRALADAIEHGRFTSSAK